ncbi:MAG: hypothetical protein RR280_01155 [Bacteroidaceae bacterium]
MMLKTLLRPMKERITETRNQVIVSVDTAQSWVTITAKDDADASVHLEGHEADNFIQAASRMYKEWNITTGDANYYLAYDYLDPIFHP